MHAPSLHSVAAAALIAALVVTPAASTTATAEDMPDVPAPLVMPDLYANPFTDDVTGSTTRGSGTRSPEPAAPSADDDADAADEPDVTVLPECAPEVENKPPECDATLSEQLNETGGVIQPPPTADDDIYVPAPDPNPGTTPVIPPSALPGQQVPDSE